MTELLRGGDLFDRVVGRGAYPQAQAAAVVRQLARALAFLHDAARVGRRRRRCNAAGAQHESIGRIARNARIARIARNARNAIVAHLVARISAI